MLLVCLLSAKISISQKAKRLSADLSLGIPVTMFSINSEPVGIYQGGLRYSFSSSFSLSSRVSYNTFFAKSNNPYSPIPITNPGVNDILNYKNTFLGINGYFQYNLTKVLGLSNNPKNKLIPYLSFGAGLLYYKIAGANTDGKTYKMEEYSSKPIRNYQLGIGARYFLSPSFDAFASSEFNYVETYWMDGAAADKKNDNYINTSFGLSYKLGSNNENNLLDWKHKNLPKVDEGAPKDYIKWSADAHLGLPYLFNPIGHNITGMGGLGIRFSATRMLSFQLAYNYGRFSGEQSVSNPFASKIKPEGVKEFSNGLNQIAMKVFVNLSRIGREPLELNKWNFYGIIGMGTLLYANDLKFADNSTNKFDYYSGTQNVVLGLQARKYINKKFDFLTGIDFNYNGSKWLDGAGDKASLNHHIYASAGISYKIANKNKRELIDWSSGNYNRIKGEKEMEVEKIPLIENKPKETPKVEEIKPIEKPKVEEPKIVEPIKEEPKVEQPRVEEPKVVIPETKIEEPKAQIKEEPKMVKETPNVTKPIIAEKSEEIAPPPYKYNVVVACYGLSHANSAFKFRDKMRLRGFEANVYKDAGNSRILKVATISTNDKATATQILRKAKKDIDPLSWIHLYNKQ